MSCEQCLNEHMHQSPKEEWQRAYAAGLDIGPEQPRTSYEEAEKTENENFMEYCREFRPDLYPVLKD